VISKDGNQKIEGKDGGQGISQKSQGIIGVQILSHDSGTNHRTKQKGRA
jgi:hypothetical protein